MSSPVVYLMACGAPPAAELPAVIEQWQADGFDVCVLATPAGARFLDADALAEQTGHPVRVEYKQPGTADVLPWADVVVLAPASFNTINKWAAGISDTLVLGILNEALGLGGPIIAAPWAKTPLRRHPAFSGNLRTVEEAGVRLIDGVDVFPWDEIRAELLKLKAAPGPR